MSFIGLIIGKIINKLISLFNLGSASTWPGHLALKIDKNFIRNILSKNKNLKTILVIGTNGKTTTVSLIKHIFKKLNIPVFSNEEGANLLNGIASTLIKTTSIFGRINYRWGIFEVDEFSFPLLLNQFTPDYLLILNLFRDQLDRYGEVNTVGLRWFNSLKNKRTITLIINGDDPFLYYQSKNLENKKVYFGIKKTLMPFKKLPYDIDFSFCPHCNQPLVYQAISYSHLGKYYCDQCGLNNKKINDFSKQNIRYPLAGLYNVYNTHGVLSLFEFLFKKLDFNNLLEDFKPAFGRQEEFFYQERKIFILLSKNPAGFNQSLLTIKNILNHKKSNFLVILNNRVPDGRDISWVWDVDFHLIFKNIKNIIVAGDRVYDLALRLKYENQKAIIETDLKKALKKLIFLTKKKERIFILPNYSAMLEIRKILLGKRFL